MCTRKLTCATCLWWGAAVKPLYFVHYYSLLGCISVSLWCKETHTLCYVRSCQVPSSPMLQHSLMQPDMVHISANGKSLNAKPFSINTLHVLVHSKAQMGIYPAALRKYQSWRAVEFQRETGKKKSGGTFCKSRHLLAFMSRAVKHDVETPWIRKT